MKALEICSTTKEKLRERQTLKGRVHSTFNRVINLELREGGLIPIITHELSPTPSFISISLENFNLLKTLGLANGIDFVMTEAKLLFTGSMPTVDLLEAKTWNAAPTFIYYRVDKDELLRKQKILKYVLLKEGNFQGIASLGLALGADKWNYGGDSPVEHNQYSRFIFPRIKELIRLIKEGSLENISQVSQRIIGFGPGLTPSADDFLSGLMVAMVYGANYNERNMEEVYTVTGKIIAGKMNRTTKVSQEMLSSAALGETSHINRQLMLSLFSRTYDQDLRRNIIAALQNGETSGTDFVAGVYVGCTLFT